MERLNRYLNSLGYSLIEMTLVMGLMVLFSLATLTLVASGSGAYKGLLHDKTDNSELRVAVAYLSNKLKQSDVSGAVSLRLQPYGEGQALVLAEDIDGEGYETWIYFHDGVLREGLIRKGTGISDELCFDIASLSGFELSWAEVGKQLHVGAWRETEQGRNLVQTTVTLTTSIR